MGRANMAANSATEQQLRIAAEFAWNIRWKIAWDMNGDGVVTISDAWLWLKWIFFAPGDLLLLLLMSYGAPIALFLEINPASMSGMLSGVISAIVWYIVAISVADNL